MMTLAKLIPITGDVARDRYGRTGRMIRPYATLSGAGSLSACRDC